MIAITSSFAFAFLALMINTSFISTKIEQVEILLDLNGCLGLFSSLFILFFIIDVVLIMFFFNFRYKKERKLNYIFKQMNLNYVDKTSITSIQLAFYFIFMHVSFICVTLPIFYYLPETINADLFNNFGVLGNESITILITYLILLGFFVLFYRVYHFIFVTKRATISNEVN